VANRRAVITAITLTTTGIMPVFLTGSMAVQIRHSLALTKTELGIAVAAFFAAATLTSLLAGRIVGRLGAATTMTVIAGFALTMDGAVALGARSPLGLILLLGAAGLANGAMQPAVNLYLSERVDQRRQGLAFGIKQAAIPLSTLLGGLAVPAIALTVGWRFGYALAIAVGITGVVLLARDPARRSPRSAPTSAPAGSVPDPTSAIGHGTARTSVALATRPLLLLAIGMALGSGAANALGAFLVTSAVSSGIAPGVAGLLAAAGSATGLCARIGAGALADRYGSRHLRAVAAMLGIGALGYLGLASHERMLLLPATMVAYGAGWGWNGLFNLSIVRAYPGAAARATGITQAGAYVGGIIGPLGVGILASHLPFTTVWFVLAATAVAAGVTVLSGSRLLDRHVARRAFAHQTSSDARPEQLTAR
jgi:MFS family permease